MTIKSLAIIFMLFCVGTTVHASSSKSKLKPTLTSLTQSTRRSLTQSTMSTKIRQQQEMGENNTHGPSGHMNF